MKNHLLKLLLLSIVAIHLLLLYHMQFFPYPELFVYSYLTTKGLLPYKQIFDQHFPGLMFFPVNFYTLGMTTPFAARFWHLGVVAATHALIFLVSKKVLKLKKWSILPNIFYLVWQPYYEGYALWIDSFMPLFLLPAYYFLAKYKKGNEKYLVFSGLLLGVAIVFKQVMIPVVGILIIYLLAKYKNLKKIYYLVAGVAAPCFLMFLYLASIGVVKDFYFWTIKFNLTTFSQMGRKNPDLGGLLKASVFFALPIFYFFYLFIKRSLNEKGLLLSLFFISSLIFAYARFDFIHLQPALAFGVIIFAPLVKKLKKEYVFFALPSYVLFAAYLLVPFYRLSISGRTFFFGEFEAKLSNEVVRYASKNDSIFAFATTPHLYVLTETLPPGQVFVFPFPWFSVDAEEKILEGIKKDMPKVVVRNKKASVQDFNLVSFMPQISEFVDENYKVVDNIQGTEIMVQK